MRRPWEKGDFAEQGWNRHSATGYQIQVFLTMVAGNRILDTGHIQRCRGQRWETIEKRPWRLRSELLLLDGFA